MRCPSLDSCHGGHRSSRAVPDNRLRTRAVSNNRLRVLDCSREARGPNQSSPKVQPPMVQPLTVPSLDPQLYTSGTSLGGVPQEQNMLKGHLPRVIYHQVHYHTKITSSREHTHPPRERALRRTPSLRRPPVSQYRRELRYRCTSLIRNIPHLGPYSRPMPRALRWSYGGGQFLMGEVPLYATLQPATECQN